MCNLHVTTSYPVPVFCFLSSQSPGMKKERIHTSPLPGEKKVFGVGVPTESVGGPSGKCLAGASIACEHVPPKREAERVQGQGSAVSALRTMLEVTSAWELQLGGQTFSFKNSVEKRRLAQIINDLVREWTVALSSLRMKTFRF